MAILQRFGNPASATFTVQLNRHSPASILAFRPLGDGIECGCVKLSQIRGGARYCYVNTRNDAVLAVANPEGRSELEAIFDAHYERIARAIARVIRDPGRAEELAVEVFLKWRSGNAEGWLYRAAVRLALDELRRQARRERYEALLGWIRKPPTPEQLHATGQQQDRVRTVLRSLNRRQAELLLLRNEGLAYNEIASALDLNPASVGTLLSRAQQNFRKEYVSRYGEQ